MDNVDVKERCFEKLNAMTKAIDDVRDEITRIVRFCGNKVIIDSECYDSPHGFGYGRIYSLEYDEELKQVLVRFEECIDDEDNDGMPYLSDFGSDWLYLILTNAIDYCEMYEKTHVIG